MKIEFIKDYGIFHFYKVDKVDSTNNYFKNNYKYYSPNSVLSADIQTNGRGRFTRVWESDNDICMSILFKENHPNSIIAALAIIMTLKIYNIEAVIKWPNDILINNKKLAGILIENIYENDLKASVVGIGINLNAKAQYESIGLKDIITDYIDKDDFIQKLLHCYQGLLDYNSDKLVSIYTKYNYVIGKEIIYLDNIYYVNGIDNNGYLIVTANGIKQIITGNEIDVKIKLNE
ncbi:MAG: biotin--[acetyl-CoA-carboxylase] ligase [Anaeroplasma sp.]